MSAIEVAAAVRGMPDGVLAGLVWVRGGVKCRVCGGELVRKAKGRPPAVHPECRGEDTRRNMLALYHRRRGAALQAARCARVPFVFVVVTVRDESVADPFGWRDGPFVYRGPLVSARAIEVPARHGSWNARRADRHEVFGEQLTYREMAHKYGADRGLSAHTIYMRVVISGWAAERACTEPVEHDPTAPKRYDLGDGRMLTVREMAEIAGVPVGTVNARLHVSGWSPARIVALSSRPSRSHDPPPSGTVWPGSRFTILGAAGVNGYGQKLWRCACACGVVKNIVAASVLRGISRSCGCATKSAAADRARARAKRHVVFGESLTVKELASIAGVTADALRVRIRNGLSAEDAAFRYNKDRKDPR